MLITRNGYAKLLKTLDKLCKVDLINAAHMLEETRPIGVSDEFPPEYIQAIESQNRIEKRILDIRNILNESTIFNSTMIKRDVDGKLQVGFGCSVSLINCNTDKEITYSIVSSYESDIQNGLISIDAPFVREMKGLKEGDIFEFNDIEYEILNVSIQ